MNVQYFISCTNCNEQYVPSAVDFRIHKIDINTKMDTCGVASPFTDKWWDPLGSTEFSCLLKNTANWKSYGEQAHLRTLTG